LLLLLSLLAFCCFAALIFNSFSPSFISAYRVGVGVAAVVVVAAAAAAACCWWCGLLRLK